MVPGEELPEATVRLPFPIVAAPDFVPIDPTQRVRSYTSPPARGDGWRADRPGDLAGPQPRGAQLGNIGPDQGYAYKLAGLFDDQLKLGAVGHDDAVAGCVALANKRSSLFGRAPVVHDLTIAFTVFGFFDENPEAELVELRDGLFAEVRSSHHYTERRHLVDLVSDEILALQPAAVADNYARDWRINLRSQ